MGKDPVVKKQAAQTEAAIQSTDKGSCRAYGRKELVFPGSDGAWRLTVEAEKLETQ